MPVITAAKSWSSHGRDGNIQQEPRPWAKIDLAHIARYTAHRRKNAYFKNEQKNLHYTSESVAIDIALEDALMAYSQNLAETKIVQIIRGYLKNDVSGKIRTDIRCLQEKLASEQNRGFHGMILRKTLEGKHKQLLVQQGTPNGTPD